MYKDDILNLIEQSPLEIDTEIQISGRPPTMANSEFLTNKEQGDWAEKIVFKAINEYSNDYFAVEYGRSESIAAGDDGFADFYMEYQSELNAIGKRPDILIFKVSDFPDRSIDVENDEHIRRAVAALEVRSSSFLAGKYAAFMRGRQQQAIKKCTEIRNAIIGTDLGNLLRRKNETIYNLISNATDDTFRELDFRCPSWSLTKELRDLTTLLKDIKENIKILHKRDYLSITRHDQSITANVLRLCNSAYFGLKRRIDSLVQAVVLIGQNQLAELVMISSCIHLFRNEHKGYNMKKGELWRHAIACALLSQIILKKMGSAPDHGLYTAALLHDIGKVILDNHMKDKYQQVIGRIQEANVSFHVAEQETLGIDHAEVGAQIMEAWNLPDNIVRGIRMHHHPEARFGSKDFGSIVHLCDLLSLHKGIGRDFYEIDAVTLKTFLETAQLSEEFVDSCTQELGGEMEKAAAFIGLV